MLRLTLIITTLCLVFLILPSLCQDRSVGRLTEVFAWKQMTYNIEGNLLVQDRFSDDVEENTRTRRDDKVYFNDNPELNRYSNNGNSGYSRPYIPRETSRPIWDINRPDTNQTITKPEEDESGRFFIQYNNVPMGVERVGDRVFITVPRRRYGIPSTVNYIDLKKEANNRSPALRPYPDLYQARALTSVYRTRADECGRLWMVDTGLLEIPNNPQQVQPPSIVAYDINTDKQILRYQFRNEDIPANNTPTGLASITLDIVNGDCSNTFAYVPDLTTFGLIVYSLADNNSWRISHSYFHFNPTAGNLRIAGQSFQWSDGIFSVTLGPRTADGCRMVYFHPLISSHEFSITTCVLNNRTASESPNTWSLYNVVGDRGENSQSTMHSYHPGSNVIFFAEIGRDSVSCWNTGRTLSGANVAILAQDNIRLSYPSDLHVTGDEVWVMSNSLPRFGYSTLDTDEYNFFVYRGRVLDLISGTVCAT